MRDVLEHTRSTQERLLLGTAGLTLFLLPVATSPAVIAGGLALLVWLGSGQWIRDARNYVRQMWFWPVALMILLPWVGMLYSSDLSEGLRLAQKSYLWLFAFVGASAFRTPQARRLGIWCFLAGLTLTAGASVLQTIGIIPLHSGYLRTGAMSHIIVSLFYTVGIATLSFVYTEHNYWKCKVIDISLILLMMFGLVVSLGRSGALALVLLMPLIALNLVGRRHLLRAAIATVILIAALIMTPPVQLRIEQASNDISRMLSQGDHSGDVSIRFHMYSSALEIITQHPIYGVGTGDVKQAMEPFRTEGIAPIDHPHNSVLYMGVSYGVAGMLALCWLWVVMLAQGYRSMRSLAGFFVMTTATVFIIGSLTDTLVLSFATANLLAISCGLIQGD